VVSNKSAQVSKKVKTNSHFIFLFQFNRLHYPTIALLHPNRVRERLSSTSSWTKI